MEKISVIICSKNEELRIKNCLKSVLANKPDEIILVDGDSTDNTVEIAKQYVSIIINSSNSNLTKDRQIGLDRSKNNYAAMIDCDHILEPNQLNDLLNEMTTNNYAIIQAQIKILNKDFWTRAENFALRITEVPGLQKQMLGTAPSIYNCKLLKNISFDSHITETIDDTDYFYRLSKLKKRFGTAHTMIKCHHEPGIANYIKKFLWYGKGDAEFGYKHKSRVKNIIFHLLIRYPIINFTKAILLLRADTALFFFLQGMTRFLSFTVNYTKLIKLNNKFF